MLFVLHKMMKNRRLRFNKNIITLLTFEMFVDNSRTAIELDYGTYFRHKDKMIGVHSESEKHHYVIISKKRACDFVNLCLSQSVLNLFDTKYIRMRKIYLCKLIHEKIAIFNGYEMQYVYNEG